MSRICTASTPGTRSNAGSNWTLSRRWCRRSSTSGGARPGCAPTRATWTARTTSSCSTPGDTRIQALVSLYAAGDARLMKNAITHLNDSRTAEGATMSRAPTRRQQYSPPFSLWWIGMVHDYFMHVDDPSFVREMLPGVRAVLGLFARHQKQSGSLAVMPWWNYVDWTTEWRSGVPPREADGSSAPLDLQLLLAYDWATQLETALGSRAMAAEYRNAAGQLRQTVRSLYWDAGNACSPIRRPTGSSRSTRTCWRCSQASPTGARRGIWSIVSWPTRRSCSARTTSATTCTRRSTWSARATVTSTCWASGSRCWREASRPSPSVTSGPATRRDPIATRGARAPTSRSSARCWASRQPRPGFQRVRIRPHPGRLERVAGSIPHPKGEISVKLARDGVGLRVEVVLPAGVSGDFAWRGSQRPLKAGANSFIVEPTSPTAR